jgi:hypothetical protein
VGWRSVRVDNEARLVLMTVQLEEAKALIERNSPAHSRLAFILLDNAAEVLMFRNVEVLLSNNPMMEGILAQWDEILKEADDPEARRQRDEVATDVVSRARRKRIEFSFEAKVDFLEEHNCLDAVEGRILKKLHRYRNELYHRDRMRDETLRSACLVYFEVASLLFERLDQYVFTIVTLKMKAPPELEKYNPPGTTSGFPSEETIAAQLRSELGIDEETLKRTLITYLTSRLEQLGTSISYVQQMLFGGLPDLLPSAPWSDGIVHLAQLHDGELPDSLDELFNARVKYNFADLARWRQAIADMGLVDGKYELFAAFADIEDQFEPLKAQMDDLVERIDIEMEREEEIRRGK